MEKDLIHLFSKISHLGFLSIIILITLITFQKVHTFQFLNLDDDLFITNNPHVKDGFTSSAIRWAFEADLIQKSKNTDYWQPITILSRMLDVELFGLNASKHHVMNLLYHLFNGMLVYLLIFSLSRNKITSFTIAMLFSIHPLQVETVAWVSARKDLLSIFFGLIALNLYSKRDLYSQRNIASIFIWIFFLLSLMAKPMLIMLPFIFVLIDYLFLERNEEIPTTKFIINAIAKKWPYLILSIIFCFIPLIGQDKVLTFFTPFELVCTAIASYGFYLMNFIFPLNLSLYGPIPNHSASAIETLISAGVVLSLSYFFMIRLKHVRQITIGWLWFLIVLIPALSMRVPADRFMYFPIIGLLIIVVFVLEEISNLYQLKKIRTSLLFIIFVACTFLSSKQIMIWKNSSTLLNHALRYNNNNYLAHTNLGHDYDQKGMKDKAIFHYATSIQLQPAYVRPYNNLGVIYGERGQIDQSISILEAGLKIKADHIEMLNNLGSAYATKGERAKALKYFERCLKIDSEYEPAKYNYDLLKPK